MTPKNIFYLALVKWSESRLKKCFAPIVNQAFTSHIPPLDCLWNIYRI